MKRVLPKWLLLIHQVPNSPPYLRIKMWRRLQKIGAVAVKNSVYVLPMSDRTLEDFQWLAKEISGGGGDASVCEATFVEGLTNAEIAQLFHVARQADYGELLDEVKELSREVHPTRSSGKQKELLTKVSKLKQKLGGIAAIDFFGASGSRQVESHIRQLESRIQAPSPRRASQERNRYLGKTWVTRSGVHVDRIASAWLIQRFIDRNAHFKFVQARGYRHGQDEIRFDMFDAEFTHEGNNCTFEVLLSRLNIVDESLRAISEIIHDIDLKESKFGRVETPGIAMLFNATCRAHKDDMRRIERMTGVLDDLYTFFKK